MAGDAVLAINISMPGTKTQPADAVSDLDPVPIVSEVELAATSVSPAAVPADQANHYLELGEFSVEAPYGTEHAQIIASTRQPQDTLPALRLDPDSGYYVIQGSVGDAKAGIIKVADFDA